MKKLSGILFFFFFLSYAHAYEERNLLQKSADEARLKQVLIPDQRWVPYPRYNDRSGWNKMTGSQKEAIIRQGEKALEFPWVVVKATDFLEYEKSGSRKRMEDPFGANTEALKDLVMAELAEGEGRFMGQIVNGVWFFCEMSTWVLSAHLPGRSLPDVNKPVIDLTSGDMGSFLAWTYYFFKEPIDKINPVISSRLRQNLQERILDPYMARSDFWWQALDLKPGGMVNNWNPWCNFNVLSAYMLLENNPEKLAAAVHKTMVSVDQFINYNQEDGACEEGPSYWGHAAGKMYDYLAMLSYATGGKVSVFDKPVIRNLGEYIAKSYIGNGWVVNFADASAKGGGSPGLIYRYGKAVKSEAMKSFSSFLAGQSKSSSHDSGRDLFRTFENLETYDEVRSAKPAVFAGTYAWYPQTEFCYMRQGDFFFAAKGGFNAESHNHNDVGTFILYYKNQPVLVDAGVGTYTRQTFSNERYQIWTMQSDFHNLPKINGVSQKFGANFRSKNAVFEEKTMKFSLDIAGAYPEEAHVQTWKRTYSLSGKKDELAIADSFELSETSAPNQINFLASGKPDIASQGLILLKSGDEELKLRYDPKLFIAEIIAIPQTDQKLSRVWGENLYRIQLNAQKSVKKGNYMFYVGK